MWKIMSVILLGLVVWVGMAMALTPTPTPVWIDMTPTHAFFQSTTTDDMVNEILTRATYWSGPNWQQPQSQAVFEAEYTTTETPEEVLTAFFNAFSTGDWQHIGSEAPEAGLAESRSFTTRFCYLQGHGTLTLGIATPVDNMTDVSIYVNFPSRYYTCENTNTAPAATSPLSRLSLIPPLVAPEGVTIVSQAQNDLENGVLHSSHEDGLLLQTTRPLADIAAAYHAQLAAAGWQLVLEEATTGAAMSTWTLPDENGAVWTGMMVFIADAEPNHYRAHIIVEPRP